MNTLNKKIELLKKIALRFNDANITWALGASMLLYFKKITIEFHIHVLNFRPLFCHLRSMGNSLKHLSS